MEGTDYLPPPIELHGAKILSSLMNTEANIKAVQRFSTRVSILSSLMNAEANINAVRYCTALKPSTKKCCTLPDFHTGNLRPDIFPIYWF